MNWLRGYGGQAPRPPPPALPPPQSVVPITCPACGSDQIKVRSSDRLTVYFQCLECDHGDGSTMWKGTGVARRVVILAPAP